ncbi:MAG: hypothetical protein JW847_01965 [Candidatus Omnitrophica bacterium]|nr:hypothetical protein [Candidatus Omnitrophota bacterium]
MRSRMILIGVLGMILFLHGCATLKGAAEGFKEDWKALGKADDWMREHLW